MVAADHYDANLAACPDDLHLHGIYFLCPDSDCSPSSTIPAADFTVDMVDVEDSNAWFRLSLPLWTRSFD